MSDPDQKAVLKRLRTLPNIGPACAADLYMLGYRDTADLKGEDPKAMYDRLCEVTHSRQDPCVLDTFISIVSFANGGPPEPWWHFTKQRKKDYPAGS